MAAISPEDQLRRFLYTSNEDGIFIAGYFPKELLSVPKLLDSRAPEVFIDIIKEAHSVNLLSHPENLLFALSAAAKNTTCEQSKHKIMVTINNLIKTAEDLFLFMKFYMRGQDKFGHFLKKIVRSYYAEKDVNELLIEVAQSKGSCSWTHKDLFKMAHVKSPTIELYLVKKYVLFGLEIAKVYAEHNDFLMPMIEKLTKYQQLKCCKSEIRTANLMLDLKCYNMRTVPSWYHNNLTIWKILVPELSLGELIVNLPKLYKLTFYKVDTLLQSKVVESLTNVEKIQNSKIHPVEVLIGLRKFEESVKLMHPTCNKTDRNPESPMCSFISALQKTLQLSFHNLSLTGSRIMISIEVRKRTMEKLCLTTKFVSAYDAAVILTLSLLKAEEDVTVAAFNNDNKITPITLEKDVSFNTALVKLKQRKCIRALPSAAIEWANSKEKQIDVFINLIYEHCPLQDLCDKDALNRYHEKMALPNTKLITILLHTPLPSVGERSPNMLYVNGFSNEVPKVIEAFIRGLFR